MSRRPGVGIARRAGFRGIGAALVAPAAPTISGTPSVGALLTITPAMGGGSVTSFAEYLDAVPTGRMVAATGSPVSYTCVLGDVFSAITFRAVGPGGRSADSNALTYALPTTNWKGGWDGSNVTNDAGTLPADGGTIKMAVDQSAAGNDLVQLTDAAQPVRRVGGGPNGRDAIDFALRSGAGTLLTKSDIGLGTGPVTIYTVTQVPTSGRYVCDAGAGNLRVIVNSGGTLLDQYSGTLACAITVNAGDWIVDVSLFNAAGSKHTVDDSAIVTGNPGASTSPGHVLGGSGTNGATQALNARVARQLVYAAAHSDAQRAEIIAYLQLWIMNTTSAARALILGDSITKGFNGTSYNGGWRPTVAAALPGLHLVGPHYSFGSHYGTSGYTAHAASLALPAFDAAIQLYLPSKIGIALNVNDDEAGDTEVHMQGYLSLLIGQAQASRPGVPVLVQNIIQPVGGLPTGDAVATAFNADFASFIGGFANVVPVVIPPGTVTSIDRTHPDDSSYQTIIAPIWIAALS